MRVCATVPYAKPSRKMETARPRREPTKPDNERSAKQSAPRLNSRLHFEIVLAFDVMGVVADGVPGHRIFARLEFGRDRDDELRFIVRSICRRAGCLLFALFVGDLDARESDFNGFVELDAKR